MPKAEESPNCFRVHPEYLATLPETFRADPGWQPMIADVNENGKSLLGNCCYKLISVSASTLAALCEYFDQEESIKNNAHAYFRQTQSPRLCDATLVCGNSGL
jgi:hypothetical protein